MKDRKKYYSRNTGSQKRNLFPSKRLGVGESRPPIGVGHIIIPPNIDRDDYIKYAYQTGEVMIITNTGEVIKDAKIPHHIVREIIFPKESIERGSLIYWNNVPLLNQVIVSGILYSPGQMYPYSEDTKVRGYIQKDIDNEWIESWDSPSCRLLWDVYANEGGTLDEEQGISLKARSPKYISEMKLSVSGIAEIYGDSLSTLKSEDKVKIQVGSRESDTETEITKLEIDRSGILSYLDRYGNTIGIDGNNGSMNLSIEKTIVMDAGEEIKLGENATESAVLGDTLVNVLGNLIDAISQLTVSTSFGPSSTPTNTPSFLAIKQTLDTIKSQLIKVE